VKSVAEVTNNYMAIFHLFSLYFKQGKNCPLNSWMVVILSCSYKQKGLSLSHCSISTCIFTCC